MRPRLLPLVLLLALPAALRADPPGAPAPFSLDGVYRLAEDMLRTELVRRVGPAAQWDVRLDREGTNLAAGRLGAVEVVGKDVRTLAGLEIARLELRADGARLGADRKSLAEDVSGTFTALVAAPALTRFARAQGGPRFADLRVRCRRNEMVLQARPEVLGVGISSEITGRPVVRRAGRVLAFRPTGVRVAGLDLPDRAADLLADRVDLTLDLAELDVPLRLEEALVSRGRLELRGRLHLSAATLARADAR